MEQTVLIVGCQTSAQNVLISALKRAGINAFGDTYDAIITNVNVPNGLILYVDAQNIRQAKAFLSQPALACTNKILVIDPRDLAARQLSATIDIDDVIFKPIRLKELISRLKLILERGYSERTSNTAFCDEIDFAQKLENFGTTQFSGALFLKGQNSNAELYFENGLVKGIRIGQKIQKNAIDAIWRVFPAKQRTIAKIEFPE
ncbi:MAG: response regulator transcription factor, partial [Proteobacteria bacterium]|nr:response regulator transcription factor [Pseudomonadota bacterium]